MAKFKAIIQVNEERCKGCGLCVAACPSDLITMSWVANSKGYNYAVLGSDKCIGCASCGQVCPDGCITVYRKKIQEE